MPKCRECGTEIISGAKFCSECGAVYVPEVNEEVSQEKTTTDLGPHIQAKISAPSKTNDKPKTIMAIAATAVLMVAIGATAFFINTKNTSTPVLNAPQANTIAQNKATEQVKPGIRAAGNEIAVTPNWEPSSNGLVWEQNSSYGIKAGSDGLYFWRDNGPTNRGCYRFAGEGQIGAVDFSNLPEDVSVEARQALGTSINKTVGRIIFSNVGGGIAIPASYSEKASLYLLSKNSNMLRILDIKTGKEYEVDWDINTIGEIAGPYVFDNDGRLWVNIYNTKTGKEYLVIYGYDKNQDIFEEICERYEVQPQFAGINLNSNCQMFAMPNGKGIALASIALVQRNSQVQLWDYNIKIHQFYWQD